LRSTPQPVKYNQLESNFDYEVNIVTITTIYVIFFSLKMLLSSQQEGKMRQLFPWDATTVGWEIGIFLEKNLMTQSREILSLRRGSSETLCSHDIFRVDRNYAAASRAKSGRNYAWKTFFWGTREKVENMASLRSDIRLPKLTSACTCLRYEKRLVVFPVPPIPSPTWRQRTNATRGEWNTPAQTGRAGRT